MNTHHCFAIDNYLVTLDLSSQVSLDDGANYRMSLINSSFPTLKGQALWSDQDNTTLYAYGGAGLGTTSVDGGIWTYDITSKSWGVEESDVDPPRLTDGGR